MGLTSHKVLAGVVLVAVLLFIATVWWWPRLARSSWRTVLGRVGLLSATQLMVFAAVGLAANQAFGFYASWADLMGREQTPGTVVEHRSAATAADTRGGESADGGRLRVNGVEPLPGGARPAAGGQLQRVDIAGGVTGTVTPAFVYLPPEYFQPRYRDRSFPAVTVLTGYPGTAEALIKGLHYPQTARKQVAAGTAQPMVLVMLRPTVAPPRDTECVDIPGGPQVETFFARDLPKVISGHYRIGAKAESWGVVGDSTGGYCALKLALHHPGAYAAGAGLSAYYRAAEDPTTGDLFHGDESLRRRADLMWGLRHLPMPRTSLLVTSSKEGEDNYRDTERFVAAVRPPARISSIVLDSGGHNFTTWRREIPATLQWLSGRLSVG
ncbi:alpha/beta hydrolase [Streptomyces tsukubensis]|uniref:Esterase n=1 Tax=Streptomyces tsukubensis TaxID=83656 RepID=A0A1V4A4D8_9ACTN|nr:alpha/beta hydrolase-fold protein [Streptomyces tsukubensis]OON75567.1 esterase [Streptomyces tsukubensis]QFR95049.1 esterase [Streptomyces tsukubensis]